MDKYINWNNCSFLNGSQVTNCTIKFTNVTNTTKTTVTVVTSKGFLKIEQVLLMFSFLIFTSLMYSCCLGRTRYHLRKVLQYRTPAKRLLSGVQSKTASKIQEETERCFNISSTLQDVHEQLIFLPLQSNVSNPSHRNHKETEIIDEAYKQSKRNPVESVRDYIFRVRKSNDKLKILQRSDQFLKVYEHAKYCPDNSGYQNHVNGFRYKETHLHWD